MIDYWTFIRLLAVLLTIYSVGVSIALVWKFTQVKVVEKSWIATREELEDCKNGNSAYVRENRKLKKELVSLKDKYYALSAKMARMKPSIEARVPRPRKQSGDQNNRQQAKELTAKEPDSSKQPALVAAVIPEEKPKVERKKPKVKSDYFKASKLIRQEEPT